MSKVSIDHDTNMNSMLPPNLRELWLGPDTYLAGNPTDEQAFPRGLPYIGWVELPAAGGRVPVPDMRARTARGGRKARLDITYAPHWC